jgi:hypothetical protein
MDLPPPYDADVFAWSQHQAAVLRRLAGGSLALPNDLDIVNVAEEIEGVGLSELNAVLSHLEGLLLHLAKAVSSSASPARRGWLEEVEEHQSQAIRRFTPGMRQRIDLDRLWQRACRRAAIALALHEEPVAELPEAMPFTLEELLDEAVEPLVLAARLAAKLLAPPTA